ncbi:murein L,D-transpeptidase catalytic domain-containing protein [Erythrobacter sp. BLCC-B19]|uniref:murein L,D-transpeptidase catalytic domain-containing protein n=1 Tax=Erythrobacter sp. BLCC-B19 TaxID=3025315 RepID=UPI00235E0029|nr:murein L,D-transpeptidase catalytic domain family protein [Erythrobacter sp. BLCC-B19]WDA42733.1 murein L,D-transpeptidase catalytic domain family protein [Erythrobacter sp. BLCC-B19]
MIRRDILKGTLAAGAALALPPRAFAQAMPGTPRDRILFDIARRELARAGNAIWKHDIVGIADFGLHSAKPRFHFVNLERGEVQSYHVSHGQGSDPQHDGWLKQFSNTEGSNATSRGAYVTWEWYKGRYGTSVRLGGLDATNDAALQRYIVMHHADYAETSHLERWGRLGRSNGCFAMGTEQFREALLHLSGGRLLFADSLGLEEDGSIQPVPELAMIDRRPLDFAPRPSISGY